MDTRKAVKTYHRNLAIVLAIIVAIFAAIPLVVDKPYIINIFVLTFYMSTLSMAWNILGGITWSTLFTLLGYFFGGIPFVQEHFELLIVGIVLVSVIPTVAGLVKAKLAKKAK